MFGQCGNLTSIPVYNTQNATDMSSMFSYCYALTTVPVLDTSSVQTMRNMFISCTALNNTSLSNILTMCINATNYTGTKTLKEIGLTSGQASTCAGLSSWATAQAAGWSTGY